MPVKSEAVLIFNLDNYKFAIALPRLLEVIESSGPAKTKEGITDAGKLLYRGEKIDVWDIRQRLEMKAGKAGKQVYLVLKINKRVVALPVDSVEGISERCDKRFPFPQIITKKKGLFTCIYLWKGEIVSGIDVEAFAL